MSPVSSSNIQNISNQNLPKEKKTFRLRSVHKDRQFQDTVMKVQRKKLQISDFYHLDGVKEKSLGQFTCLVEKYKQIGVKEILTYICEERKASVVENLCHSMKEVHFQLDFLKSVTKNQNMGSIKVTPFHRHALIIEFEGVLGYYRLKDTFKKTDFEPVLYSSTLSSL